MKPNPDIEAVLDRSLERQLVAPRLDRRFDAAVWSRIDAESNRSAAPVVRAPIPRWLFASNLIAVAAAIVLSLYFGAQALSGLEMSVDLPQVSPTAAAQIADLAVKCITGVALVFGLMFTPLGRRLRSELS